METLFYLLKVGAIYAGLYIIYYTLFRRNTNFQINRSYLLVIIPIAFILPLINTTIQVASEYQIILPTFETGNTATTASSTNWNSILLYTYALFSTLLLIKFLINLIKTLQVISKIKQGEDNEIQPFSFFSFIHVPPSIEGTDRDAILHHEEIHSTQLHSIDIIIYEISKVLLWWNPFLWMGLHSVKSNHEFIADKLASEKADKYSSVLVAQLLGVNCSVLANNFNYEPLIKKRIMMMKTKKSNRLSVFKYALVVPVIGLTFLASAQKDQSDSKADFADVAEISDTAPTPEPTPEPIFEPTPWEPSAETHNEDKIYDKVEVMPEFKGGMDALMKYLGNTIKYPAEAKKNNIEGKAFVSFVIDVKGKINSVEMVKPINPLLDKEAMRVIASMPKWKPGKKDGKKVNVKFVIPINFKLKN